MLPTSERLKQLRTGESEPRTCGDWGFRCSFLAAYGKLWCFFPKVAFKAVMLLDMDMDMA